MLTVLRRVPLRATPALGCSCRRASSSSGQEPPSSDEPVATSAPAASDTDAPDVRPPGSSAQKATNRGRAFQLSGRRALARDAFQIAHPGGSAPSASPLRAVRVVKVATEEQIEQREARMAEQEVSRAEKTERRRVHDLGRRNKFSRINPDGTTSELEDYVVNYHAIPAKLAKSDLQILRSFKQSDLHFSPAKMTEKLSTIRMPGDLPLAKQESKIQSMPKPSPQKGQKGSTGSWKVVPGEGGKGQMRLMSTFTSDAEPPMAAPSPLEVDAATRLVEEVQLSAGEQGAEPESEVAEMDAPPHLEAASIVPPTTTKPASKGNWASPPWKYPPTRRGPNLGDSVHPLRPFSAYSHQLSSSHINITPVLPSLPGPPIATLAHNLDRVLFNPGVHWVRDPRSGVYNFDHQIEIIPPVDSFQFEKLSRYIRSSEDEILAGIAKREGKKFVSSTSSTTGMMCQIYFWLSGGKEVNTSMLSSDWSDEPKTFTAGQQLPASVIVHEKSGVYAIDADKSMDQDISTNILASLGNLMEKLLTTEKEVFKGFLDGAKSPAASEVDVKQAYHYIATDQMVLRSQLDAHNVHLPNYSFDVKTRGVVAIRQDRLNHQEAGGYLISSLRGKASSFEKEYYDLIRSAFLKYTFQARIGCMDGCFIAYHNGARIFGFQYCSIEEMEESLYGSKEEGEMVYRLCLGMLERVLGDVVDSFGVGKGVKLMFEAHEEGLNVFIEPLHPETGEVGLKLLRIEGNNFVDGVGMREVDIGGNIRARRAKEVSKVLREAELAEQFSKEIEMMEQEEADEVHGEEEPPKPKYRNPRHPPIPSTSPPTSDLPTPPNARLPNWVVGYNSTLHDGTGEISTASIKERFDATRARQTRFSTILLPSGVTTGIISDAHIRADEDLRLKMNPAPPLPVVDFDTNLTLSDHLPPPPAPIRPSDAASTAIVRRFPKLKGMKYTSRHHHGVLELRRLSREGTKELIRRREVDRKAGKVVQMAGGGMVVKKL